jgi:hypothetical protein
MALMVTVWVKMGVETGDWRLETGDGDGDEARSLSLQNDFIVDSASGTENPLRPGSYVGSRL